MEQEDMFLKHSVMRHRVSGQVLDTLFSLHFPDVELVLDVTYGLGAFWRGWSRPLPFNVHVTDLNQEKVNGALVDALRRDEIVPLQAMDARDLRRIRPDSYDVGVFDPPFLANYTTTHKTLNLDKKYGTLPSQREILALYWAGIQELVRVCRVGMIVKCKPGVSSHVLWPTRWAVTTYGSMACGRFPEDIAVFVPPSNVLRGRWKTQHHLRRTESYFIVWDFDKGVRWTAIPGWGE